MIEKSFALRRKLKMSNNSDMKRNREATTQRILHAAGQLLVESGLETWGVNAIAKEAGVDKVLIYRYFAGLPGLAEQLAAQTVLFPESLLGASWEEWALSLWRHWEETKFALAVIRTGLARPQTPWASQLNTQQARCTARLAERLDHVAASIIADVFLAAMVEAAAAGHSWETARRRARLFTGSGAAIRSEAGRDDSASEKVELPPEML